MHTRVRIELENLGRSIEVERGSRLRDVLQAYGVEFPCGGRGRCKRCRIRVLEGVLASDPGGPEVEPGWSLACHARVESDVVLQLEQFGARILSHDSAFRFEPAEGYGIAVDLGTTTLVGQLIELRTGRVRAVECALNPQRAHGSDIMQRTQHVCEHGAEELQRSIRREIGTMLRKLVSIESQAEDGLKRVVIVGNTVMHHIFCGLDLEPLARFPFESSQTGLQTLEPQVLGWDLAGNPTVCFLPCIGGFVGSDVLAGVLATGLQESSALELLVDLGTNGEIVLGNAEKIWCASTAAGPAFEAGCIEMGMQATTGAIHEVLVAPSGDGSGGVLRCGVLGQVDPRGLCGSGLVDAVAAGLNLGRIDASGRLHGPGRVFELCGAVHLTQNDIRQLQLAKAAIAAGIRILLRRCGAEAHEVQRVYLAGAFGNYVSRESSRRIGLIEFPEDRVESVGNSALLGAKIALFESSLEKGRLGALRARMEHVSLASETDFQQVFLDQISFPSRLREGGTLE